MLQILTVERKVFNSYHIETTLRTQEGKVKAIFNSMLRQPKYGQKEITINSFKWGLNWEYVKTKKR